MKNCGPDLLWDRKNDEMVSGQNDQLAQIQSNCQYAVRHILGWLLRCQWTSFTHHTHDPLNPRDRQHQHNINPLNVLLLLCPEIHTSRYKLTCSACADLCSCLMGHYAHCVVGVAWQFWCHIMCCACLWYTSAGHAHLRFCNLEPWTLWVGWTYECMIVSVFIAILIIVQYRSSETYRHIKGDVGTVWKLESLRRTTLQKNFAEEY